MMTELYFLGEQSLYEKVFIPPNIDICMVKNLCQTLHQIAQTASKQMVCAFTIVFSTNSLHSTVYIFSFIRS